MIRTIGLKLSLLFALCLSSVIFLPRVADAQTRTVTYSPTTVAPNYSGSISVQDTNGFEFRGPYSFTATATNVGTSTQYSLTCRIYTPWAFWIYYSNSLPSGVYTITFDGTGLDMHTTGTETLTPNFTVGNVPTISSVTPSSANVGDPDTSIAIVGTYFQSGATVDWNGTPLTTTYTDAQDLVCNHSRRPTWQRRARLILPSSTQTPVLAPR